MLYDNALCIIALCNAFLLTKKDIYKNAVSHTCDFIFSEMKNEDGGYYAALDADSEGVEGKFYVWNKPEIDAVLGEDASLFNAYYNVTEAGNWEHTNILRILRPLEEVALAFDLSPEAAENIISAAKEKLLAVRAKRIRPGTDDKILLGWNALLAIAFCKAYAALQEEKYRDAAIELFNFIETKFPADNGAYHHTYKEGVAKYPAFLDDYTYLADACIHLQEITAEEKYLQKAKELTEYVLDNFADSESEYFFFTSKEQEDIAVRKIELYDGATPAANSVMAKNLLYLSIVFEKMEWHHKSVAMINSLKNIITKHPGSFGIWAATAMNIAAGINEIAIIGRDMMPALREVLLQYIPNKVLQANKEASNMPLLREKQVLAQTSLYLCRNYECKNPVHSAEKLFQALNVQVF